VTHSEEEDMSEEKKMNLAEVKHPTPTKSPAEAGNMDKAKSEAMYLDNVPPEFKGNSGTRSVGSYSNTGEGFPGADGTTAPAHGSVNVNTAGSGTVSTQGKVGNVTTVSSGQVNINFATGRCPQPPP
jgi:hypothetical protein